MSGVDVKLLGPEPIFYQALEVPRHSDGSILEYSDCVEVSLLSFLRYVIADSLDPERLAKQEGGEPHYPKVDFERLARLTEDEAIHQWFQQQPIIYPDDYYRFPRCWPFQPRIDWRTRPGVLERIEWTRLMALRPSLVYNFNASEPPQRDPGSPVTSQGTYELRACVPGFLRLMAFFFPKAGVDGSYTPPPLSAPLLQTELDKLSHFFSAPDRPVKFHLKNHSERPIDEDHTIYVTDIRISGGDGEPIYQWLLSELYSEGVRINGHSHFDWVREDED